jgi:hypothetical protein
MDIVPFLYTNGKQVKTENLCKSVFKLHSQISINGFTLLLHQHIENGMLNEMVTINYFHFSFWRLPFLYLRLQFNHHKDLKNLESM